MPGRWPLIVDGPFNFHPGENHAGATLFRAQWIDPIRWTRAEQPRGVGTDGLTREEPNIQFSDAWFGLGVERAHAAEEARRSFGIDGNGLRAMAWRDIVQIRDVPALFVFAGPDPNRISFETQLI